MGAKYKQSKRDYSAPGKTPRVPATLDRVPHKICGQCSDLPHCRPQRGACKCNRWRGEAPLAKPRALLGSSGGW